MIEKWGGGGHERMEERIQKNSSFGAICDMGEHQRKKRRVALDECTLEFGKKENQCGGGVQFK